MTSTSDEASRDGLEGLAVIPVTVDWHEAGAEMRFALGMELGLG